MLRRLCSDLSLSAAVAGLVAVLVGYSSSVAIVFQAARALGATPEQTASWMWALGLAMGLTCMGLSLCYRQPVLTAWCTPGAALLAATQGVALSDAIGAFVVCAVLIVAAGVTGLFERLMNRVPLAIATALLAGVLTRFGLDGVLAVRSEPALVLALGAAFIAARRFWPRYAVPLVLLLGMAIVAVQGRLADADVRWVWAAPVWVTPTFKLSVLIGLALPLFIVTMASQNLPGVAAQRAAGYATPVSPVITATGLVTLVGAPFGAFAINLAAITAAICMGREAHADPARRYMASFMAGVFYTLLGLAGGTVALLLGAFPRELVVAVAALALLSTITGALATALKDEQHRDAAGLTFLVTLSGMGPLGIGSAFWGLLAGGLTLAVQHWRAAR